MTRRLVTIVLAVLLALSTASCGIGGIGGSGKLTITAYFPQAAGVFVGNDVGVLGVPVGKITAITPDGDKAKVQMEIDADQPIPASAGAVVVSRSAATDRYVELTPVWASGPKMRSGAVIPLDRTRTPVEFDEVLSTLGSFADDIGGNQETAQAVSRLLDSTVTTFKGRGNLINAALTSLAGATNTLSGQRKNAEQTLVALDGLTSKLARNQQVIRRFIQQVSTASAILAEERENFRSALTASTRAVRVVADFAQRNRAEIKRTVALTHGTLKTIQDKRSQVEEILRVTPLAMQNLKRIQGRDGRLLVRLDFLALSPLGGLLDQVCKALPGDLCTNIGLDPGGLLGALGGLLGGRQ